MNTFTIEAEPGVALAATTYSPDGSPSLAVVISSGTGYARSFYRHLAEFFRGQGALVVTYDFRGIADSSAPALLERADLPDWGRDLDAVLRWVSSKYPSVPIAHVGHSAGGHIVAFSEESHRVRKHIFLAVGAGTLWQHFVRRWPLELYFWWVLGTVSLARWGHIRPVGGWSGSPLPGPVFRTWRRWSHRHRYYFDAVSTWRLARPAVLANVPIESWVFTDDGICTPRSAQTIVDCFPDAPASIRKVAPADYGLSKLGHDGVFRRESALWRELWLSLTE